MASAGDTLQNSARKAGLHAGRYELLTRLAAGGMGEVFIARVLGDGDFEKRVALKLLLPHLSSETEFVHMFLDEARIAARMNHPNIVQIFDLGEAEGRYFIAMALVEGVSLSRLLKACRAKNEVLPMPVVRLIAAGLCTGLSYAHEKGIVHRDVNPSNLLVSTAGAVLLTDFGIAKAQGNLHRTRPGDVKGKFAYMAPEQMLGKFDHRADLFSAAVTLFETATLVSPFARPTDPQTIDAVRTVTLPSMPKLRADVPDAWREAITRGTQRNVDERIASARLLRDALADGPVAAPHELGEWVERLCADELKAFRSLPAESRRESGTALIRGSPRESSNPTEPISLPRRRWPWVVAAGVAVATIAAVAWNWPESKQESAAEVQPVADPVAVAPAPSPAPVVREEPAPAPPPAPAPAPEPVKRSAKASAKAEAPKNEPLKIGYLTADAVPWAKVMVDGRELETTPVSKYPMKVGRYSLVFSGPNGREETRKVTIEEGKTATVRVDFNQ